MRLTIHHFVATSVLAHGVFLIAWASTTTHYRLIPASLSSAPQLHVSIVQRNDQAWTEQREHRIIKRHKFHRTKISPQTRLNKEPNKASHPTTTTLTATRHAISHPDAHKAILQRKLIRDRVLSQIRNDLQRYFVYPQLAQREGWQGKVLLGFSLAADGAIRNIHVASGSGYAILDNSAVTALSRVKTMYVSTDWSQGKPIELQLPVIFCLQGG